MVYIDDVVINLESMLEHIDQLEIFTKISENALKVILCKCQFVKDRIEAPDYIIGSRRLEADPSNTSFWKVHDSLRQRRPQITSHVMLD